MTRNFWSYFWKGFDEDGNQGYAPSYRARRLAEKQQETYNRVLSGPNGKNLPYDNSGGGILTEATPEQGDKDPQEQRRRGGSIQRQPLPDTHIPRDPADCGGLEIRQTDTGIHYSAGTGADCFKCVL